MKQQQMGLTKKCSCFYFLFLLMLLLFQLESSSPSSGSTHDHGSASHVRSSFKPVSDSSQQFKPVQSRGGFEAGNHDHHHKAKKDGDEKRKVYTVWLQQAHIEKQRQMATIIAPKQFSPVEDAENIKKACQGWGTDEKAIISILGHRNLFQRKLVRLAFEEIYHQDLFQQLKCELSGDFERAVSLWTLDPADRDAFLANEALQKAVPDYRVIVEIACIGSPEDLLAVKRAYKFRYKRSLEEDLASFTTGDIRKLLVAVTSAYRYDGDEFDETLAHSEAIILHQDIHGKALNHEEVIRILSTRSKAQLNATFNLYKDIHGRSITKGFPGGPNDDYFSTLRTVIRCIRDPKKYFAKVLRAAINMAGTDEDGLSRVIIGRAEKDLKEIKELYLKRNNVSLDDAVARECSGDYKAFLLALLGAN